MSWLTGWISRKSHLINGSTVGAQSNYPVCIIVHYGSGVDSGGDVYCDGGCKTDFGDIRFTKFDGVTPLDYWIEAKVDGDYAIFWVEIDSIPISPGYATIYIYYGKGDATTTSNGSATFLWFNDFSSVIGFNRFPYGQPDEVGVDPGAWSLVSGYLKHIEGIANTHEHALINVANAGVVIRAKINFLTLAALEAPGVAGRYTHSGAHANTYIVRIEYYPASIFRLLKQYNGVGTDLGGYAFVPSGNTWYDIELRMYGNQLRAFLNKVDRIDAVDNDMASGAELGCHGEYSLNSDQAFDDFYVRPYVEPEPSNGTWGGVEHAPGWVPSIAMYLATDEPPIAGRTIYMDVLNLPDPVILSPEYMAFNYDAVGLYFQLVATGVGWTFPASTNLGLIGAGGNARFVHDQYGSRARPAADTLETITLTLKAYTDAGYSVLKWTFVRTVYVHFIKSDDGSWTLDVLNNFDDGTVQGWAATLEVGDAASVAVAADFCLSPPYSLRLDEAAPVGVWPINTEVRAYIYKVFNTPNKNYVLAIMDLMIRSTDGNQYPKYIEMRRNGTVLMNLGQPYDIVHTSYMPKDRWIRALVLLPKNTALTLKIVLDCLFYVPDAFYRHAYLYMDDFKIISKD